MPAVPAGGRGLGVGVACCHVPVDGGSPANNSQIVCVIDYDDTWSPVDGVSVRGQGVGVVVVWGAPPLPWLQPAVGHSPGVSAPVPRLQLQQES